MFFISGPHSEPVSFLLLKLLTEKHKDEVKQIKFKDEEKGLIHFQDGEVCGGCQAS